MGAPGRCGSALCQGQAGVNFRDQPVTCGESWEHLHSRRESTICCTKLNQRQELGHQEQNTAE